jgi:hypothetical protein
MTFSVTLRTDPDRAYRRLAKLLKTAWRRDRLQVIDAYEHPRGARPPRRAGSHLAAGVRTMAIGKRKTSTEFMPTAKYDARYGSFYSETRVLTQDGWKPEQNNLTEVLRTQGAIFDLESGERGWIKFVKGAAPDMVLVPFGADPGEAPSPDHKEGLRLVVKFAGDEPREFLSTAVAAWGAIDSVHTAFEKQRKENAGKVPVLKLTDVIETKSANNTSFIPVFVIDHWVIRPSDLPAPAGGKPAKPVRTGAAKHADMDDEIAF